MKRGNQGYFFAFDKDNGESFMSWQQSVLPHPFWVGLAIGRAALEVVWAMSAVTVTDVSSYQE